MDELRPASPELVAHYRNNIKEHGCIADVLLIPCFSKELKRDLLRLLCDKEAVELLESATRIGNFGDTKDIAEMRRAVARDLKRRGVKMPRGKRPSYGLSELVERLAPIFLHFGLPLASGEGSPLVLGLRRVAEDLSIKGDARDEIRRLIRHKRLIEANTRKAIFDAFANGLAPLRVNASLISPPPG